MIITDRSKTLHITLSSNITSTLKLYWKKNGTLSSGMDSTYNSTDKTHSWTVPFTTFSLNDEITDFSVKTSNTAIHNLNEGITWLVDGEEVTTVYGSNEYTTKFDKGEHTIQAVYRGNDDYNMSYTPIRSFKIGGGYNLEFVNKKLDLSYNDRQKVQFKLTNNGVPVANAIVQIVRGQPFASNNLILATNSNGIVEYTNSLMNAGTVTLGAFYEDNNDNTLAQVYKKFFIHKSDPYIQEDGDLNVNQNDYITINFKQGWSNGENIVGEKVTVYINGAKFTRTINENGKIGFKATQKGTFKFRVAYRGNNNLNAKTMTFTKKVV